MRTGWQTLLGGFLLASGTVLAQPIQPPIPALPPGEPVSNPVPLPKGDPSQFPGGTTVSQPLQPVGPAPTVIEPDPPAPVIETAPPPQPDPIPGRILGGFWDDDQLLIWWPKAHPIPPLVAGTRLGGPPVLGRPGTTVLIGNKAIDNQDIAGGRFTLGWSLTNDDTIGIDGNYFFLGTRTLSESVTDITNPRYKAIGLPFVNAVTGLDDVLTVASPGISSALVTVSTTTRVQGAEINGIANLHAGKNWKLHGLAGYRFFQLQEGLRVEQQWLQYPEATGYKTFGMIADQFDAHNRFNGGQLGLHSDLQRGPVFVEMTAKVALGSTFQVVKTDGATHLITAAYPVPLLRSYPGGVYAQLTNMGRTTHSAFAVLPEATFKVGLKAERARFYVGYNFLYLSDVVRPGDQIDRTLNPAQIPLLNPGGSFTGPDRPRVALNRTDFWVQGLIIGLEGRY